MRRSRQQRKIMSGLIDYLVLAICLLTLLLSLK